MSEGVETVICEEICEEGEEADMAESMEKLLTAEFKEAFDEFDKVGKTEGRFLFVKISQKKTKTRMSSIKKCVNSKSLVNIFVM